MHNENDKKIMTFDEARLVTKSGWEAMTNDIEKYQVLKGYLINSFRKVLEYSPQQIRTVIEATIVRLEDTDPIFEIDELMSFLKLVQIRSTTILSSLDDKTVPDYAAPHRAFTMLDNYLRENGDEKFTEENFDDLAAKFTYGLHALGLHLLDIDWKKGWG